MKYIKTYEAGNWDRIKNIRLAQDEKARKEAAERKLANQKVVDKLNDKYDFNFEVKPHNIQADLDASICKGTMIEDITKDVYLVIDRIKGDNFDCTIWFNHTIHLKDHFKFLPYRLSHITHDEGIWVGQKEVTSVFITTSVDNFLQDIKVRLDELDGVLNKLLREKDRGENLINSLDEIKSIFNEIRDHDKCKSFNMEHSGYNITIDMNFELPYKKSSPGVVEFKFNNDYDEYMSLINNIKERLRVIDDFKIKGRMELDQQRLTLLVSAEI